MLSQIPSLAKDIQYPQIFPQSELSPSQPTLELLPQPIPSKSVDQQLVSLWNTIIATTDLAAFCSAIKEYCLLIVNSPDEDIFVAFFIEKKFMSMLKIKINEWKAEGDILRTVFSLFEFLLKALKKEVQLIYFLVKLSQEGFITSDYVFKEEQDEAYYANFLKLMIRKINEDSKYLSVFFNSREPQFPLLLQLLRMHDCKDSIMHTSSKLAILQISNNPTPLVQSYMHNFPFVLFYPLYVVRVTNHLKEFLHEEDPLSLQHLQSSLKYLEDFSEGKERAAIDMYTNSFLCLVGKYIYEQLMTLNEKNLGNAIKLLKGLWTKVIPEISVVKVRIALLCLFAPLIPSRMKRCFQYKAQQLESKYWIPQTCSEQVDEHCRAVFYKEEPQNRSFLRSINSYIPRTKDNWLYHELKKISTLIGYDINLNEPINIEKVQKESFLFALSMMIDDQVVPNPLFASIMKTKSEELLYYYLRVLAALSQYQEEQSLIELDTVVQFTTTCTSLSLLQALHTLVTKLSIAPIKSDYLQQVYSKVIEKLTHFVLTKGWAELLARVKETRLPGDEEPFLHDIYRQLECDILLFVTLRTLLGTHNSQCNKFQTQRWQGYPAIAVETTFKCKDSSKFGQLVYAILDGQFLLLKNTEEQLINKKELLITDMQIYEDGQLIQVVANRTNCNFCMTLHLDKDVRQYFLREVANRKLMTQRVALELKQLYFPINNS